MLLLKSAYVIVLANSNQQIIEIGVHTNLSVVEFEGLVKDHTWNFLYGVTMLVLATPTFFMLW